MVILLNWIEFHKASYNVCKWLQWAPTMKTVVHSFSYSIFRDISSAVLNETVVKLLQINEQNDKNNPIL